MSETTIAPTDERLASWQLSDEELAAALLEGERAARRVHAGMLELLGEGERRGLGRRLGYSGTGGFLRDELHLSAREVRARLSEVEATQPARTVGGEVRSAPLAATGAALAAGAISPEHVLAVCAVFDDCPASVDAPARAEVEQVLLDLAAQATPDAVRKAGRRLVAYWQADGTEPHAEELSAPRRAFRYRYKRSGDLEFSGLLDAETGATLEGLFGPLAQPRPITDGARDVRSRDERQGDALAEIIDCAARAEDQTVQGGERAVITATMTLAELEGRAEKALLDVPGCTSLDQLRRLACEAAVVPAIFGASGEPLYLGRTARHANRAQRRALALRDGGCAWPGCDREPKWTVVHHVVFWEHGGPTDIDLMVLLCTTHHRAIHHTAWEVRIDPLTKLPEFLPPARLDPERAPLRNETHRIAPTTATVATATRAPRSRTEPPTSGSPWRHARGTCTRAP